MVAIKDAVRFIREVQVELSKVVWPKFDEFVGATLVVLVLVCVFAVYLFCVDQVLTSCVQYVLGIGG